MHTRNMHKCTHTSALAVSERKVEPSGHLQRACVCAWWVHQVSFRAPPQGQCSRSAMPPENNALAFINLSICGGVDIIAAMHRWLSTNLAKCGAFPIGEVCVCVFAARRVRSSWARHDTSMSLLILLSLMEVYTQNKYVRRRLFA
jgi:hypothetical protein